MLEIPNTEEFKKDFFNGMNCMTLANKNFVSLSTVYKWIKSLELDRKRKIIPKEKTN
jgi:transposase